MSKLIIWIFPAPDAFFWVGTEGSPDNVADVSTTKILVPNTGEVYEYDDQAKASTDKYLLPAFNDKDITLKMPSTMTVW